MIYFFLVREVVMFSVNYVDPKQPLVFDQRESGPGNTKLTDAIDVRVIELSDIRQSRESFSLDIQGFKPVIFNPEFQEFSDDTAITTHLYPKVEELIMKELNALDIVIFDHTFRSSTRSDKTVHNRAPVKTVHNDYTVSSANRMFEIQTQEKPELKGKPYQIVNLWLPVLNEVEESPLAFIDLSTVDSKDFNKLKLIYPDRVGEISGISFNPEHKWFYQSRMKPGEAILFKVFDSNCNGNIVGVPHSAVDGQLEQQANTVHKRSSLEFRTIVFKEP